MLIINFLLYIINIHAVAHGAIRITYFSRMYLYNQREDRLPLHNLLYPIPGCDHLQISCLHKHRIFAILHKELPQDLVVLNIAIYFKQ